MKKKSSKKEPFSLTVQKRNIFGKKLKALRKQGKLPANIFGEDIKSQAVMLPIKEFLQVYRKAGQTQIVYLQLDSQEELPVLIQNVQYHPVTDFLLHADFRKIDLKKKIETDVPVKFIGQSEAVTQTKGILLTISESLRVEALPGAIPSLIEVDISPLKELNDEIKVKDIKVEGDYLIKENPEKTVVRITAHKEEAVETQVVAPETVEVTTEKKVKGEVLAGKEKTAAVSPKETKPEPAPVKEEKK